jgi:uncharacterized protein (TIGR02996 family)
MLPPSSTLTALLLAAQAEPEEDTSRLVLADFLDDAGDPRGAMVRASLRLARLQPGDPGWYELSDELSAWQARYQGDWLGKSGAVKVSLKRGLLSLSLEAATLAGPGLPRKARAALEEGWVGDVVCHEIDDAALEEAATQGRLERVSGLLANYWPLSKTGWARLGSLAELRRLRLSYGPHLTDENLIFLTALPLQELAIQGRLTLTEGSLEHLGRLRHLRKAEVGFEHSEDRLERLAPLTDLRSLAIMPLRLTGAGLAHLAHLPLLAELAVWPIYRVEEQHFPRLALLPRLRHLRLPLSSDDSVKHLTTLAGLSSFDGSSSLLTGAGLRHLAGLTGLRSLSLEYCRELTDEGVASLAELSGLERLSLRQTTVSDAALAPLARLTRLRSLDLSGNHRLTGTGMAFLKGLPHLRRLDLFDCAGLNKKDLPHLAELTQLRELDVSRCILRRTTVERLRKALPQCRFTQS